MPENRERTGFRGPSPEVGKATRFKPGQSGNPGGRPKNDLGRIIAQAVIENNQEAVYRALTKALLKGNPYLFKVLADRAYGKVSDKVELTGAGGGPIEYKGMSDTDLDARIRQLEIDLGYAKQIDESP